MFRLLFALGLSLALVAPAAAQPVPIPAAVGDGPFDPPAELAPASGAAVYVPPTTVVSAVYVGLDGEEPFDVRAVGGSPTAFVLLTRGLPPGTKYRFVGVGSDKAGQLTRKAFTVVIPGPPVPPTPVPPTPPAPNPYRAQLKAVFDLDAGDGLAKEAVRQKLVELYRQAVTLAADPAVTSTDVLRERLRRAADSLAATDLRGTRTAIANLLAPALPLGQPLTPESRAAAAALFRAISEGLTW